MRAPPRSQKRMRKSLRCYMNWLALDGLGPFAEGPLAAIRQAGYDGVQFVDFPSPAEVAAARALGLGVCGSARVNVPEDAARVAAQAREASLECLTLHVGWGMESEDEAARLIESILDAAAKYALPLYVETHRATLFQDMWRTVQLLQRFPQLEFNGDFSHWYTGSEMVYGGFERKLEFLAPVLERVRFLHGRIGNPGCIQVDIGDGSAQAHPYVEHFRQLWTAAFAGYLRSAARQEFLCFTCELLAPSIYYARTFAGREESDRWQQSLVLAQLARECFAAAESTMSGPLIS
ncbi:MAG: sugar phosphate isomerase/epimerase family protein [Acidobacteriaceae bacterium]